MFTKSQTQAINENGKNIIVSAGAGSGKTAVLTERIIKHIQDGVDIRKLLVLTFTNAAAAEMKERVSDKLKALNLTEALNLINVSSITTFDAYSLELVKKYYFLLGLDKDICVANEVLLNEEKNKILDNMFDELYASENPDFLNLLKKYTDKDDTLIKNLIYSISNTVDQLPSVDDYFANYDKYFYNDDYLDSLVLRYEKIVLEKCYSFGQTITNNLMFFSDQINMNVYSYLETLRIMISKLNSYDDAKDLFFNIKIPSLSRKNELDSPKEALKIIKDELKELSDHYFSYISKKSMKENILKTKDDAVFLMNITKALIAKMTTFKRKKNYFSFYDIAKMAIKLVKDFSRIREEVKKSYYEILIDEYQDTSDLQDAFISLVENNNVYMVGDIKQSIYRFRNANPIIFKEKYDLYSLGGANLKIDLNENFRSRQEVIDNINLIFNNLMTMEHGDADYVNAHQMIFGQTLYNKDKNDINHNMEVLEYNKPDSKDFQTDEIEAFIMGRDILKKLDSYVVFDKNTKEFRKCSHKDFCILIDRTTQFLTIKKVLEYLGIPTTIYADSDLKNGIISKLVLNILILINKTKNNEFDIDYKHALVSIMRSFIMEFNDSFILETKDDLNNPVCMIIKDIVKNTMDMSMPNVYLYALDAFDVYEKLPKIADVEDSLVQLEFIYKTLVEFSKIGNTFEEIVNLLSDIFDSDNRITYNAILDSSDSVRIMTIHKSKGLEFPICYYPMLDKKFNRPELKETMGFSNKYGLYLPAIDNGYNNTIIKDLIKDDFLTYDTSEKIRLFYVALTRAREKIVLIRRGIDNSQMPFKYRNNFNEYLNDLDLQDYTDYVDLKSINLTLAYKKSSSSKSLDNTSKEVLVYNDLTLDNNLSKKGVISKELLNITSDELKETLKLGTEFHKALEDLDFYSMDFEALDTQAYIKDVLKTLMANDIFKDIKKAKIYKEHEFIFTKEDIEYHGIIDLMVIYDNHIDIIDYKLSNLDKAEYLNQLGVYKAYASCNSNKVINTYLLSIKKNEIKKVEV